MPAAQQAVLRRVVHRKPIAHMPFAHIPEYLLVYVVETLECGHTVDTYPQCDALIAKYRRCKRCDEMNLAAANVPKKPSASVKLPVVLKAVQKKAA